MVPPVHSRTFLPFDFFFAGRRRPAPSGGGSSGAVRRRRGGGTSRSGAVEGPTPRALRRRAPRGPGTVDCGAEGLSRSSYSPVSGLSTHWSAGSMFSARPRLCASTVVRILRRGRAAPSPQGARSRSLGARPRAEPRGRAHRSAHINRPVRYGATAVTHSTNLTTGQYGAFLGQLSALPRPPHARHASSWNALYSQTSSAAVFPLNVGAGESPSPGSRGSPEPAGASGSAAAAIATGSSVRRRVNSFSASGCTSWSRLASPAYDSGERSGIARVRWECRAAPYEVVQTTQTRQIRIRREGRRGRVQNGIQLHRIQQYVIALHLVDERTQKRCCRSIRSVSLPSPSDLRART